MERVNFLPKSYSKIYEQKNNIKKTITFVILVIIESVVLFSTIKNFNSYSKINEELIEKNIILDNLMQKQNYDDLYKKNREVDQIDYVKNHILSMVDYRSIFLKNSIAILNINVANNSEYLGIIQKIENDKNCKVLHITPLKKKDNIYEFIVKVEMKKNVKMEDSKKS